jgi:Family of unknown function (DUF6428)
MKLSELKTLCKANPKKKIRFVLPDGDEIPAHFHVTEVGYVAKRFIDCGGVTGESEACLLQTWIGDDTEHQLTAGRFAEILQLGDRVLPHDRLEVEVEYDCCVVGQYSVAQTKVPPGRIELFLANKRTQCLARERRKVAVDSACCGAETRC